MKRFNSPIPTTIQVIFTAIIFSFVAAGCSDSSTGSDPPPEESEYSLRTISTSSDGDVLADREGNALYFFTPDTEGESTCEGECLNNWPVFAVDSMMLEEGIPADQVGSINRSDGSTQTTFKGWPLYYYSGDTEPGEVLGDEIESFGGVWYAAKTNYTIMHATQQLIGHDEENYIVDEGGNYMTGEGTTTHFTDGEGRTLYIFINDSANTNNYTSEDFSNNEVWPVYEEELQSLAGGLDEALFGSIDVYGRQQLTYKGWPLYYFEQDESQRGHTRGISYPEVGLWPVAQQRMGEAPGYVPPDGDSDDDNGDDGPRY